ncbi:SusC/RagA family TonB-linked outer membrane protein [Pedobacter sp. SYSU D00535]|uniref:SusC/RagA family TonB-linked outer membrane protein n=1 Tax=Pedobacter sp. SYSU D00535 TaxID=2810308 RepID=UPI001A964222|nr:SusC/RagA family TonB-linked outer membrane protein [Pedobacter sp. SYSU D00535]
MFKCILLLVLISAAETFSKGYSQTTITLHANNVPIKKVLREIERTTEYRFLYNDDVISGAKVRDVNAKNATLDEVMQSLLENTDLTYKKTSGNLVVLSVKPSTQILNITGTVVDSKGEPLPGVTVKIKGTNTATSTDVNGVFRLNVPNGDETLVISFIGFKTQEIAVNRQTSLNVRLQEDSQSLEQVIVTGYGTTTTKGATTSAIDAIRSEEIEDLPVGNLSTALAGRLLGASVDGGITRPGASASLTIRNPVSLARNPMTTPLYVIDDVIQINGQTGAPDNTLFNSLDASEIESITILKDAAAAIYGSRAANGAVIVKTKRGKEGAPRISYSGQFGSNDEAYRTKMLSAYEMGQYVNIMNGPNGYNRSASDPQYFFSADELETMKNLNYDWLEDNWKTSYNMRHTFNVSGGANNSTYFANFSYYTQDGNIGKLDHNRYTFRAGADVNLATGLKAGLQVSGNFQDISRINNELGGEDAERDYKTLIQTPRYIPMYVDGLPVRVPGTGYHFNEIERTNNYRENDNRTTVVNLYAEYELPFLKGLKARAQYARTMGNGTDSRIGGRYNTYDFETKTGGNNHLYEGATNPRLVVISNDNRVRFFNDRSYNTQFNFSTSYSGNIGKHSFGAFATVERQETGLNREEVRKENPIIGSNGQLNTAFGEIGGNSTAFEGGSLGYVARANYSFDNKYLVDLMFRSDASTKFAPENYWGKFYSLGTGWVISEENFFNISAVDFLKIRYSIGLLGADDTELWTWRQRYTYQNGKGGVFGTATNIPAGTGMKMEASPNRDQTWSSQVKHNLGLDARFLQSRLSATVEGFFTRATDLLLIPTAGIPATAGGSVAAQNFGAGDLFGYEIALGWNATIGRKFTYGIDTRFQWYDNRMHSGNFNSTQAAFPWLAQPGQSSDNGQWGYDYLGMFRDQAEIDAYVQQYKITQVTDLNGGNAVLASQFKPGMLYYRDVRGALQADGTFAGPDGIINGNDRVQLSKKAQNHYSFGTTLKAAYKGFSLDAVISGSFGGWAEHTGRSAMDSRIIELDQNQPALWNNIYDPVLNPGGTLPNPAFNVNYSPSSQFWRVSSFRMRMNNFNVSYSVPQSIAKTLRVRNARVSLTAMNPFNLANPYDYRDSQVGWDLYPVIRTYSLGVNLSL